MAVNNVFIKDLPYEFLKTKSGEFFSSPEYKGMQDLFDSKKTPAPMLADAPPLDVMPDQLLNYARDLVVKRYMGDTVIAETEDEMIGVMYTKMLSKIGIKMKRSQKMLRPITKDLTNYVVLPATVIRREVEPPDIRRFRNGSLDKVGMQIPAMTGLRPEKTSDPVLDVVAGSLFYQNTMSNDVFDDVKFRNNKINDFIQDSIVREEGVSHGLEVFRDPAEVDVNYAFRYSDIDATVKLVRESFIDKYFSSFNSKAKLTMDADALKQSIRMNFRITPVPRDPFSIFRFTSSEQTPQSDYTVTHNLRSSNIISGTIMVDQSDEFSCTGVTADSENTAKVVLTDPSNVLVTIVSSNVSDAQFRLKDMLKDKKVLVRVINFDFADTWRLDFEGLDDGFLIDFETDQDPTLKPKSIKLVDPNRAEIAFDFPVSGKLYLMANSENVLTDGDIVVTKDNVENVLASTNFYRKGFKIWK